MTPWTVPHHYREW